MRAAILALIALLLAPAAGAQTVRFVDESAGPGGDGLSWDTAFVEFFDALDAAAGDPTVEQIWVAQGTYAPGRGAGDRNDTFQLVSGTGVFGGFAGGETELDQRDPDSNPTVLSGDLAGDDTVVLPEGDVPPLPTFLNYDENAFHVVTASGVDDTTVIDGFIIRGGNANFAGSLLLGGGGLFAVNGSPSIRACTFVENRAGTGEPDIGGFGGGLFVHGGQPAISDCRFVRNRAMNGGGLAFRQSAGSEIVRCTVSDSSFIDNFSEFQTGGAAWTIAEELAYVDCTFENNFAQYGGAMLDQDSLHFSITGCTFSGNRSLVNAGAVWHVCPTVGCVDVEPALIRECRFIGNEVPQGSGGAITLGSAKGIVANCEFFGNVAAVGGAIASSPFAEGAADDLTVYNCLFSGNSALRGGGIGTRFNPALRVGSSTFVFNSATQFGGGVFIEQSLVEPALIDNCILWNNDVNGVMDEFGQIIGGIKEMNHCLVQGLFESTGGIGNIDADPMFVDAEGADGVPGTPDDDVRVAAGSPAIDAGNRQALPGDALDLDGDGDLAEPIPLDLDGHQRVMGEEVDMGAYELGQDVCPADTNDDGVVDVLDLVAVVLGWNTSDPDVDVNADGIVDVEDLVAVVLGWGPCARRRVTKRISIPLSAGLGSP